MSLKEYLFPFLESWRFRFSSAKKARCLVNGVEMDLDLREGIQRQMAKGLYEPAQTAWVKKHLKAGGTFVDVGASFGHYTTLARSIVGPEGHVFAFDPSPVAYATLKAAIDRAGLSNVTLVNAAVGKSDGDLVLYMPPESANLHSPSAFESHPNFSSITVPMLKLDSYAPLNACAVIDMLKMDVEGSEPDVLDGMQSLIENRRVHRVICEFNSWWLNANNTSVEALFEKFNHYGFVVEDTTEWKRNQPAVKGETFDLQDVLFRHVSAS